MKHKTILLTKNNIEMKSFKVCFLHIDGSSREVLIEAFNEERARLRFEINWGSDMKITKLELASK